MTAGAGPLGRALVQILMRTRLLVLCLTALVGGGALTAASLRAAQRAADLTPPAGSSFYGLTPQFAVSADGKQAVYVAQTGMAQALLWVQALDGTPHVVAGTEQATY